MTVRRISPPPGPVRSVAYPPGSKSHTIRALFMAACADGESEILGALDSDDTARARECLRQLGIEIKDETEAWRISGTGGYFERPANPLEAGESGLTARFLMAIVGLVDGEVTIQGHGRLPERPMSALIEALGRLGIGVTASHPWHVEGIGSIAGGSVDVDGSSSSQVISALLLVAPLADGTLRIVPTGEVSSSAYVDMTLEMMEAFGVHTTSGDSGWEVPVAQYQPTRLTIPIDASAMVYPAAAAAISGGFVEIYGDPGSHPDIRFFDAITEMGCVVNRSDSVTTVVGPEILTGLDTDMSQSPDAAVALAVLCALAAGPSRLSGLATLRLKESDRLSALQEELSKIGATVEISRDSLLIEPAQSINAARLDSHQDHRLAMSLALLGLVVDGIEIGGSDSVAKTWPEFWQWFASLGSEVARI